MPEIAVFAGPTATVLNSSPPRTSQKAREKYGLPPLTDSHGQPVRRDQLTFQRLAAPVTVYIEQFSAGPLERDEAGLFAPPDGYLDANNVFHQDRSSPADRPVYQVTLRPEDGLYPLPYMARRADGSAWEDWEPAPGAPDGMIRQTFFPDASWLFEEIERMGAETSGNVFARAHFDFFRPAPPGGYRQGLPAARRTDKGAGDIPPERPGFDYFPYGWKGTDQSYDDFDPPRERLARMTTAVQEQLGSGRYRGALWLEGSSRIEDTIYWLNLLIDTDAMIVGVAANRPNRLLSSDGPLTIADAVDFVLSDVWRDADGRNRVGDVLVQDQRILTAREATKKAARPGGYGTLGGHGGVIGSVFGPKLTFLPLTRHGRTSDVRYTAIPVHVAGVRRNPRGGLEPMQVTVKDDAGHLRGAAIPYVELLEFNEWLTANPPGTPDPVVPRVESAIARCHGQSPLGGLVVEDSTGSHFDRPDLLMIDRAALSGLAVVKVYRGTPQMFVGDTPDNLYLEGSNLNANKARLLLMACLMRFGAPPPAADPAHPTPAEMAAVKKYLVPLQQVFDTH